MNFDKKLKYLQALVDLKRLNVNVENEILEVVAKLQELMNGSDEVYSRVERIVDEYEEVNKKFNGEDASLDDNEYLKIASYIYLKSQIDPTGIELTEEQSKEIVDFVNNKVTSVE